MENKTKKCPFCNTLIRDRSEKCRRHSMIGNKNSEKGENIGYFGIHKWLVKNFGKANKCEECGDKKAKRYEWANIDKVYKKERSHFVMLCKRCHNKMDIWNYNLKVKKHG